MLSRLFYHWRLLTTCRIQNVAVRMMLYTPILLAGDRSITDIFFTARICNFLLYSYKIALFVNFENSQKTDLLINSQLFLLLKRKLVFINWIFYTTNYTIASRGWASAERFSSCILNLDDDDDNDHLLLLLLKLDKTHLIHED